MKAELKAEHKKHICKGMLVVGTQCRGERLLPHPLPSHLANDLANVL